MKNNSDKNRSKNMNNGSKEPEMTNAIRLKRVHYLIATIIFLAIEVFIALFVHDKFIRPYIGDVLVVIVIYTFIRIFIPEKLKLLPLYVFIFAFVVEFLQYVKIVEILGLQNVAFFRVLIGTVFDWKDIGCYFAGCVLLEVYELVIYSRNHIN